MRLDQLPRSDNVEDRRGQDGLRSGKVESCDTFNAL
jgi:hypothetical protein